jgi:hypothetical protein
MPIGTIKIYDRQNKCGCVQDDADHIVYFFDRGCLGQDYHPRKGDHFVYNVKTNVRNGRRDFRLIRKNAPACPWAA